MSKDAARRYIAGSVIARAAETAPTERPALADRVAVLLRELDEFGVECVAQTLGWTPCCDGTGLVKDCAHASRGAVCPCRELACTDCRGE